MIKRMSRERNTTFVVVTHDLDLASEMDKTYILQDGKLVLSELNVSTNYIDDFENSFKKLKA